jgi:hypothetical protein
MKRRPLVLGLIGAAVCCGNAFAGGPATPCPTTFTCAFDAAEVRPLSDPTNLRTPAVYVGYIVFDSSGNPTMTVLGNLNGTVQTLATFTGTCTAGASGVPGTLDFETAGPKLGFVSDDSGNELRTIVTEDVNHGTSTPVTLGVCTAL